MRARTKKPVSLRRHRRDCRICAHADKAAIEEAFLAWQGVGKIAQQYGLADRAAIYRHAHALGLFQMRQGNLRFALSKIVEHVDDLLDVNAGQVVAAIVALSKINSLGRFVEPTGFSLDALFGRLSRAELERYAQSGELPAWAEETIRTQGYFEPNPTEADDD